MNPGMIISLIAAILFVLFLIFIPRRKKGQKGEHKVSKVLGQSIKDQQYVINNITIVNEGKSSQIDHVLINRTGIFVIETKNYSGRIYGAENQREWTQVLQYGKVKNQFYNPIMQNKTHIFALSKVLNRNDCFISFVVFPEAELMNKTLTNVGSIRDLQLILRQQRIGMFTVDEINSIYTQLLDFKVNPRVSEKEHIASIKQMQTNINNNRCPRCGKPLVKRSSDYGAFYGCSGYPACTFKMKE